MTNYTVFFKSLYCFKGPFFAIFHPTGATWELLDLRIVPNDRPEKEPFHGRSLATPCHTRRRVYGFNAVKQGLLTNGVDQTH